jgi:DNA-binding transcriptional regulator YiaG
MGLGLQVPTGETSDMKRRKKKEVYTEKDKKMAELGLAQIAKIAEADRGLQEALQGMRIEYLVAMRKMLGMTQDNMAGLMGQSRSWVSQVETGQAPVPVGYMYKLKDIVMTAVSQGITVKTQERTKKGREEKANESD